MVGTVAPISKKSTAGSTGKSGAGIVSKSGKTGSGFGSGGKGSNVFGSSGKTGKTSAVGGTFGTSVKSSSPFGSNAKSSGGYGTGGKSPSLPKTPSFMPLGTSNKDDSFRPKDKKSTVPLLLGGKTTSAFASSPNKSYPSTSFANPKKSKTTFGIIWLPSRKHNRKKEYVHVSHNDHGYKERSPSMYPQHPHEHHHMSGDSSTHPFKKKEEESNLLVMERPKGPIATAASAGAATVTAEDKSFLAQDTTENNDPDEKQELTKQDKDDTKEAAGDASFEKDKDSKSFLDNENDSKFSDNMNPKDRGDKVDSIYLRPPPPHKVRSNTSTVEDEDCGIKCLYYTLQCCDCVLM